MASLLASPEIAISCVGTRGGIPTKLFSKASPRNRGGFRCSEDKEILGSRVRVCSSTRYCEVNKDLDLDLDLERYDEFSWQFSAPVKESSSSKQNKDDEEKQNYYVNTGYAIRTLREEFPQIFYKEISFGIYRDDIVFKDPLNTFIGIENYKSIFSALRFYGRIFFKALWIDIVSVSQPIDREIMVRWTVHGIPRVPWESRGRFDATSEYKLDKNGKIYEHRVQNIVLNSPPRFRVLAVEELIQSLGSPSTPKPTYFEILSSSLVRSMPLLVRFTWVRYYLAFKLALAWRCSEEELVS